MENGSNLFGYVQIITVGDTENLEKAINDATAGKRFEIQGFTVDSKSNYSVILYFQGEKPHADKLEQNLSEQERWTIERNSALELVRQYGLEQAASQFGLKPAKLKKDYNL